MRIVAINPSRPFVKSRTFHPILREMVSKSSVFYHFIVSLLLLNLHYFMFFFFSENENRYIRRTIGTNSIKTKSRRKSKLQVRSLSLSLSLSLIVFKNELYFRSQDISTSKLNTIVETISWIFLTRFEFRHLTS